MRMDTLIVGVACLVLGFLGGYFFDKSAPTSTTAVQQQGTPQNSTPIDLKARIAELEKVTSAQPDNRQAWITLGNNYFDTDQPMKAAEAYDRALALDPKDANVLVDQGVMYRRMGWFDRAIANFDKALVLRPNHPTAVFNKGVVYRYDLQDFPKAVEAWELFLQLNPNAPNADTLRAEIAFMKNHPPTDKKP